VNSSSEEWLSVRARLGRRDRAAGNRDPLEDARWDDRQSASGVGGS